MAVETNTEPGFELSFEMELERGPPVSVGETGLGGARRYVPVAGGKISGPGFSGKVLSGGETLLERGDGVTVVEATYYLANADGWVACGIARGYRTTGEALAGSRMALLFETDQEGPLAHLGMTAFVAEEGENGRVGIYRIT